LILEIQQTPAEYLPNLLQIVRLFRESVTLKPVPSDDLEQNATPKTLEANRLDQMKSINGKITTFHAKQALSQYSN
jgi:hypothetical protein